MSVLIAIEGIDGAGKGTQTAKLTGSLRELGYRAEMLQFPRYSATRFGSAIGDFLNGRFGSLQEVHPQLASVLYAGDRYESLPVLKQLMSENDVVVLDRFVGSNLAHQGAKLHGHERTRLLGWIEEIEYEVFQLPRPDLTLLIDMSSSWSRELVSRKAARDYTEQTADLQEADSPYLERVRLCYREIAVSRTDWTLIEGVTPSGDLRSIDEIAGDIRERVCSVMAADRNSGRHQASSL